MTFRDLIGRTLRIRGFDVTFRHWQRHHHSRVYINAPGSTCHRTDHVDLHTGELSCSPQAIAFIETALETQEEPWNPATSQQ